MRGFPMQQGVKEEEEAHAAYHGAPGTKSEQSIVQDESALGKNIEGQLNKAMIKNLAMLKLGKLYTTGKTQNTTLKTIE